MLALDFLRVCGTYSLTREVSQVSQCQVECCLQSDGQTGQAVQGPRPVIPTEVDKVDEPPGASDKVFCATFLLQDTPGKKNRVLRLSEDGKEMEKTKRNEKKEVRQ